MDERDYSAFVRLSGSLHFAQTARSLGMSASALTRRVQAMEEELGHELVARAGKPELTPAGRVFLSFCREELERIEELKNRLSAESESPSGDLHIACTVTACHTVLPRLLACFRREVPRVNLHLVTGDAARSLEQLEKDEVDLAVIPTGEAKTPGLSRQVLGHTELSWIAPRDSSALDIKSDRPRDFFQLPIIAAESGLDRERLSQFLAARGIAPRFSAEVRGNEAIIALVGLGSGVALVPRLVLESSPLKQRVRVMSQIPAPPGYDVSLCTKDRSLERRIVSAFWAIAAPD